MNSLASCASTHFMQRAAREVARVMEFSGGTKLRILFVEDESSCRNSIRLLFRHPLLSGFAVDFAGDSNEAMSLIVCNVYDLAIVDCNLDAWHARTLVADWVDHGYQLPFMVTGSPGVAKEMLSLGSSGFIEKADALNPALLSRALKKAMDGFWIDRCK